MTKRAASLKRASKSVSLTGSRGAESTTTKSNLLRRVRNQILQRVRRHQIGWVARLRSAGQYKCLVTACRSTTHFSNTERPSKTSTMPPADAAIFIVRATEGRRKSASTMMTRRPLRAARRARLTAMTVLPSPGTAEVTSNTFGASLAFSSERPRWSPLIDSANEEDG